jgi:hypothetical protein
VLHGKHASGESAVVKVKKIRLRRYKEAWYAAERFRGVGENTSRRP